MMLGQPVSQASAKGGPERVKGTVLLNCAGGMNTKVSK